jgi:hypothetical protein
MYDSPSDKGIQVSVGFAGPGFMMVAIISLIVMGLAIAAAGAVVAGAVVVALLKVFDWERAPGYWRAYLASFWGIFALLAVSFVIDLVLPYQKEPWDPPTLFHSNQQLLAYMSREEWALWPILPTLLARFGPGLLVCAAILQRRLADAFTGPTGYLKACAVSLLAVLSSLYAVVVIGQRFVRLLATYPGGWPRIGEDTLLVVLVISVFSIIGGLVASVVILVARKLSASAREASLGRIYLTAALALAACSVVTVIVLSVYPGTGLVDRFLEGLVASDEPLAYLRHTDLAPLAGPFGNFLVRQLPGLFVSAALITILLGRPFLGPAGYVRAVVTGGVAFAGSWLVCLAGALTLFVALGHQ